MTDRKQLIRQVADLPTASDIKVIHDLDKAEAFARLRKLKDLLHQLGQIGSPAARKARRAEAAATKFPFNATASRNKFARSTASSVCVASSANSLVRTSGSGSAASPHAQVGAAGVLKSGRWDWKAYVG
ncbi:MAG: hypothetical protein C0467_29255 [Planctomycetaceae bacterium]|nr:hypothetical protein [Planctomycetaceae bacterium]